MAKSPIGKTMPLDIEEFFASPFVQQMKDFQRWWYVSLLMNEWRNSEKPGFLPNDREQLWVLAGAASKEHFEKHGAIVMARFDASEDELWLSNKKLLQVYERQLLKYSKWAGNGSLGGRPKTKSKPIGNQTETIGCAFDSALAVDLKESRFELPIWVPEKAWLAFLQMRQAIKKPPTVEAKKRLIVKLEKLMQDGHNPEAVLWESVTNNWAGLYPLKEPYGTGQNNAGGRQSAGQARTERTRSVLSEVLRERHGDSALDGSDMPSDQHGNNVSGVRAVLVRGAKGVSGGGD